MTLYSLFDHQGGERSREVSTEATVLDIHGDGHLRVLHRREAHEDRMVLALVLSCSRLTTYLIERRVDACRRTAGHCCPHAEDHCVECFA